MTEQQDLENDDELDEKDEPSVTEEGDNTIVDLEPRKSRRERRAERPNLMSRVAEAEREAREAREEASKARAEVAQSRERSQPKQQDELASIFKEQQDLARRAASSPDREAEHWDEYQKLEQRKFQAQARANGYAPAGDVEARTQQASAEMTMRMNFPDVMSNPRAFEVAKNYYQIERQKNPNAEGATLLERAMEYARRDFGLKKSPAPSQGDKEMFTGPGKSAGPSGGSNRFVLSAEARQFADISHRHIKDPTLRYSTYAKQVMAQRKRAG